MFKKDHDKIVFSKEEISQRIQELGKQISKDYSDKPLVMLGVLTGSMYFLADLTRSLDIPVQIDFMAIGNYAGTTSQKGTVRITKDLDLDITDKHVLIIEDILRTGLTIGYLVQNLEARHPASVKICTLLINPQEQLINVPVEYYGFEIDRKRLVGYGMDINEEYRHLPYIAELK